MKKILWFCGYTGVAALAAFLLTALFETSFWACFFLEGIIAGTWYLAWFLRQKSPKLTKWLFRLGVLILASQITILWLGDALPFTRDTLPYAIGAREARMSRAMDKGLAKAQVAFLVSLRKQEDELEKQITILMAAKKYDEATNAYAVQRAIRAKIESVLGPIAPPTSTTAEPPPKSQVVSYTVNQNEVISTLSIPDNSTVYMEADKAFCILEKYGTNDDGSEKLSRMTILSGKSSRHFTWGGRLRVIGLSDGTTIKLHL